VVTVVAGRGSQQCPTSAWQCENYRAGDAPEATARPKAWRRCSGRDSCRSCRCGRYVSPMWDLGGRGSGAARDGQQQHDRGPTWQ